MNKATGPVAELLALIHPAGMRQADIYTNLEFLVENPPGRSTIYRAVDELEDHGYVEKLENSDDHYRLTQTGFDWLDGEIENVEIVSELRESRD